MKNRLKSLAAPKTWEIKRKKHVWTMKCKGPHRIEQSIPVGTILKEYFKYAKTTKDAKNIVYRKGVFVNGRRINDICYGVGIMDVFEIPELKEKYLMLINTRGKLCMVKTDIEFIISKITGKKTVKGKTQLNLFGGGNVIAEKDGFKTGDTLLLGLKDGKIKEHIRLAEGAVCMLLGGNHVEERGNIKGIHEEKLIITGEDKKEFETLKRFVYVVGKEKSPINVCAK